MSETIPRRVPRPVYTIYPAQAVPVEPATLERVRDALIRQQLRDRLERLRRTRSRPGCGS